MFSKAICETALTGSAADRLFTNITDYDAPDKSFLSTMRALLRKRLKPDESVYLCCRKVYLSANDLSAMTPMRCLNNLIPIEITNQSPTGYNIYIIHTETPEAGAKMLEIISANAGSGKRRMSNFTRREDLRVFYARTLNALFYTDETLRNTVIFTDNLDLKRFHILQMMLPKYLPSLFDNSPLTENEIALLKSTGNKSAIDYEKLITEFSKDFDIRSETIRLKLAGFESAFERMRIGELKSEITRHQEDCDAHLAVMRDLTDKIKNCQYTLASLECSVNNKSGDSELTEYFMCNKNLNLIRVNGTLMEFITHGYADIYDEDAFIQYAGNHAGYM